MIKEHFLLNNSNGSFSIENRHRTNGTYIGSTNLKGAKPYKLKDGDQIVLPVQEKGKLVSLIIVFHLSNEPEVEPEEIHGQNIMNRIMKSKVRIYPLMSMLM